MLFINLQDHNIDFTYHYKMNIEDSEVGTWLKDNKIKYCVTTSGYTKINPAYEDIIVINELQFFKEEDMVAFKLRWSN